MASPKALSLQRSQHSTDAHLGLPELCLLRLPLNLWDVGIEFGMPCCAAIPATSTMVDMCCYVAVSTVGLLCKHTGMHLMLH